MSQSLNESSFWVINTTNRNVCLSDLAITIPARRCWDLLNKRRFNFTIEQLMDSMKSGSLYKKRAFIKIGKGPPEESRLPNRTVSKYPIHIRPRSIVQVDEPQFEELIFSDQQYAEEMAREEEE